MDQLGRIKAMLADQRREVDDLLADVQRKELSRERLLRLMKIVSRNIELLELVVDVLQSGRSDDQRP